MGKKDINEFTDKETARREDAVLKRVSLDAAEA
jgi:hypothetical protein